MSWFTDKTRCYNGGQQHRYEARYTEVPYPAKISTGTMEITPDECRRLMVLNIYVRDVCAWCGASIQVPKGKA